MNVIWHKIARDLMQNRARTLLTIFSTAVGVLALGLVLGLSGVMGTRLTEEHRSSLPAHITVQGGPFGPEDVAAVLREPGVAGVEGRVGISFRWKKAGETEWHNGILMAREDYEQQTVGRIGLLEGRWPGDRELAVEVQSARYLDLSTDMDLLVEFGRRERRLPVRGVIHDPAVLGPQMMGTTTFFAAPETVAWLSGQGEHWTQLVIRLETFHAQEAVGVAERIENRLEQMGRPAAGYGISDPNVHPMQEIVSTLFLILTVLSVLSLGLSAFLIVNIMNALVAQQVRQIGVMKAVGATFGHVIRVYLVVALLYGGLALLVAVPLAAVGAHWLAGGLLEILNVSRGAFRIVPAAVIVQALVGFAVPVLASLLPAIGGARISVRQAINQYGLGMGFGHSWLDRFLGRVRTLPRPMALSLRNTFRRKARVSLTLVTLVVGGAMFIMVVSVDTSFNHSVEVLMEGLGHDVMIMLDGYYRASRLANLAETVPGVTRVEVWDQREAAIVLPSGEQLEIQLWGMPEDSRLFRPEVIGGRLLLPGDGRAILLDNNVAVQEGIGVGDMVKVTIGGQESSWQVVGLVLSISAMTDDCYVPLRALARESGAVNQGNQVFVQAAQHDEQSHEALAQALQDAYSMRHIGINMTQTATENREQNRNIFRAISSLLLVMAVLAAAVGGIGLMGTMSLNVVERGREIGVMRAIGGQSKAISGIFVGEGVFLGLLSCLIAVPVSYPGARLFGYLVGTAMLNRPLYFHYSLGAALLWLGIATLLSALASLWPARRATRVTVREALAYE